MNKIFEKDELKINVSINSKGFVDNIAVLIKDELFFNKLEDKREIDRVCTQIFNTLNQIFNNVKPIIEHKKENVVKNNIEMDCTNPNCDNKNFKLVRPCCEEKKILAKEGIVAVLECIKCKQRKWVNENEYKTLLDS